MFKISKICAVAALATAPVALADELSDTGDFLDGVAAIVNEGVVLKSQLNRQLDEIARRAQSQGIPLPPADVLEEQILERLIVTEIQLQRAERIGLQVSDQSLNQAAWRSDQPFHEPKTFSQTTMPAPFISASCISLR